MIYLYPLSILTFFSQVSNQFPIISLPFPIKIKISHYLTTPTMMNTKEKILDLGLSLSLNSPWINTTYFISPPAEEIEKEKEEEERVSSPDSTVSSVSGKRLERSGSGNTGSRTVISDEDEDDGPGGSCSRKKLRLSKEQSAVLEDCFRAHSTLNPHQKQALAAQLGLRPRQVEVWFQNRRARTKLKQTEVDCEYLKRWCDRLTDENKRLQKEVAELRALKAASSTQAIPPPVSMTTLAMCPSCQRVSSSSKSPNLFTANNATATTTAATVMDTSKQAALSNYCQLFPMAAGSNQNMWTSTNALHTRELF